MLPAQRWYLGFLLSLLNCALSSIGFTMQRKAYLLSAAAQVRDESEGHRMSRLHAAMLYCGIVLYIFAAVPDVYAYMVAPQVVPTAFTCFRLVVITAFAHCFLEEKVKTQEVVGMLACSVGTFLCLIFGPNSVTRKNEPDERRAFPPSVIVYICLGLAMLCVLLVVEHVACLIHHLADHNEPAPLHGFTKIVVEAEKAENFGFSYCALPLATGLAFALEKVFNTEMGHLDGPTSPEEFFRDFCRMSPAWYGAFTGVVMLGLLDLYLNLRAAKKMPVQIFQPCAFAVGTLLQYVQSIAIFGEFAQLSAIQIVLSVFGAILSLAGALYIRPPRFTRVCPRLTELAQQTEPACDAPPARYKSSSFSTSSPRCTSSSTSSTMSIVYFRELLGDEESYEGGAVDNLEIGFHHTKAASADGSRGGAPGTTSNGHSLKTPLR